MYLNDYQDYEDAYRRIGHFLGDVYMTKRVHSALGYLTPAEPVLARDRPGFETLQLAQPLA